MRKLLISFFFIQNIIYSQDFKITQVELDSIDLYNASTEKIDSFKMFLESNKKLKGWVNYYSGKGFSKYWQKEYDSVIFYQKKAIETYNELKIKRNIDEKKLLLAYFYLGKILTLKKDYSNALLNFQKSSELLKKYPYKWKSFITTSIADCHLELGNAKTALNYYKKALKDPIYNSLDKSNIILNTRIGVTYLEEINNKDSAKYYLNIALKKSLNSTYKINLAGIHSNLGFIHEIENRIDSAKYHYKLQNKLYKKYNPTYPNAYLFILLNKIYIQIHETDYEAAITNLKIANDSIQRIRNIDKNDKNLHLSLFNRFILYYDKTNNHKEALKKSEEKFVFINNFKNKLLDEKLSNLEIQYQTKQKDASIKQLELNKEQQNTIIKQQQVIGYSLGGLFILLLGFGALFWKQRKLQVQYEKENLEQRLLRSQMNPHFIFNALNSICGLIENKSNNAIQYVNKLADLFRLTLINSREEFVNLEEEIRLLKNYLELQSHFSHDFDFEFNILNNIDEERIIIPPMLIQPFVENSILHGFTSLDIRGKINIDISIQEEHKLLLCKIKDNGIGYSEATKTKVLRNHKSVSQDIVKERLSLLKKKFKVNTRFVVKKNDSIGTCVELYLPYLID